LATIEVQDAAGALFSGPLPVKSAGGDDSIVPYQHDNDIAYDESKTVHVTGNELGDVRGTKNLRMAAEKYVEEFAKKIVKIESTGKSVYLSKRGIIHTLRMNRNEDAILAITVLPELLRRSVKISCEAYEGNSVGIRSVERYQASVCVRGKKYIAEMIIRVLDDGSKIGTDMVFYHQKLKGRH